MYVPVCVYVLCVCVCECKNKQEWPTWNVNALQSLVLPKGHSKRVARRQQQQQQRHNDATATPTTTLPLTATPTLASHRPGFNSSPAWMEPCTEPNSYVNFAQGELRMWKGEGEEERERDMESGRRRVGAGRIVSGTCCLCIKCDKWMGPQVEPKELTGLLPVSPSLSLSLSYSLSQFYPFLPLSPSTSSRMCGAKLNL